jgi:hypothetical protein
MYKTKTLHNHTVTYLEVDDAERWLDVAGPNVTKWTLDCVDVPVDDTTGLATAYTTTLVNASTFALVAGAFGGNCIFTAAGAENDGVNMQLKGEPFYLVGNYPAYFGIRYQVADADQTDIFLGLSITDTTACTAVSDGVFFRAVDQSAALSFVVEKDSAESITSVLTQVDATWYVAEFYYDGTNVYAYINGALVATVANTDTNFPDDEYLTPTIAMLSGEGAANTLTVDWARAFQIRE